MKFTQTNVNKLPAPKGGDVTIWDEALPGFGIRFRNGGAGTYIIRYRLNGKQQRLPLGAVAQVTLEDAQIEAKQLFAKVAKAVDPAEERRVATAAALNKAAAAQTIGLLAPLFIASQEAKGRVKSYLDENRRSLYRLDKDGVQDAYFAELHGFAPDAVTRRMIAAELNEINADCGPIAMTRCRAHLHKFWNWAIAQGYVDGGNPVSGTEKFNPKARDRRHNAKELAIIWRESDDDNDYDVIQKLVMLTGARRNQIGALKRKEVNRDERLITLVGPGRSKNGTKFLLPVSKQALALINLVWDRRDDKSNYLFGNGGDNGGGFSGWSNCAANFADNIRSLIEEDYWLHDFRRTFQTIGQTELKIPLHITDACLNHIGGVATAGSKKHYNFAEYFDEKVKAMNQWGNYIEGVVGRKANLKVAA